MTPAESMPDSIILWVAISSGVVMGIGVAAMICLSEITRSVERIAAALESHQPEKPGK